MLEFLVLHFTCWTKPGRNLFKLFKQPLVKVSKDEHWGIQFILKMMLDAVQDLSCWYIRYINYAHKDVSKLSWEVVWSQSDTKQLQVRVTYSVSDSDVAAPTSLTCTSHLGISWRGCEMVDSLKPLQLWEHSLSLTPQIHNQVFPGDLMNGSSG